MRLLIIAVALTLGLGACYVRGNAGHGHWFGNPHEYASYPGMNGHSRVYGHHYGHHHHW